MAPEAVDYSLLDRIALRAPLFYPQRSESSPPAFATDHLIEVASDVSLGARFYLGDIDWPTILYFHGNGEVAADHDDIAPHYHRIGINLFVADYRGYGQSSGQPTFVSLIADAHAVAERFHAMLDDRQMRGPRFVMGRSLGAHPALELAARRPDRLRGVIIESGAADMRRLYERFAAPAPSIEAEALIASNESKIACVTLPALLLHGERDTLIPPVFAQHVHDLIRSAERTIVIIARAGHNDIFWVGGERYLGAVQRFVRQHGG